jgi:AcrR family transcriptional regulator
LCSAASTDPPATTIADIAAAAEVSPRTVTMYFPAKQDIALSRVSDGVTGLADAIRDRPPGETLHDAFGRWLLTSVAGPEREQAVAAAMRFLEAGTAAL